MCVCVYVLRIRKRIELSYAFAAYVERKENGHTYRAMEPLEWMHFPYPNIHRRLLQVQLFTNDGQTIIVT